MSKKLFALLCTSLLCLSLTACVTGRRDTTTTTPQIQVTTRDNVKIVLPVNYSQKNYKRMNVGVSIKAETDFLEPSKHFYLDNKEVLDSGKLPLETITRYLLEEIAGLKRFTTISPKELQKAINKSHQGTANFEDAFEVNFVLSCTYSVVREEFERVDHNDIFYIVRLDYQLVDLVTGETIDTNHVEGREKRIAVFLPSGEWLGGFHPTKNNEAEVIKQAVNNALILLCNKLATDLPLGAQVTDIRPDRVIIDKGFGEGLESKHMVILYTDVDGYDIPFAAAELSPSNHESIGKICKWGDSKEAKQLVKELKTDPKNFLSNRDVFVVTSGMPWPRHWEMRYEN